MKSERRHELQHNVLADWLAQTFEALKPYQNVILGIALVGAVALAGWALMSRESQARNTQAWSDLSRAMASGNPSALDDVAENHAGSTVGALAALVSADQRFAEGCRLLFVNKASAMEELNKAVSLYELVLQRRGTPSLWPRATYKLAMAKEAKGTAAEIEEAVKLYEEVAKQWPGCAFAAAAAERAEQLKQPAIKEFYDRFAHFNPKPITPPGPGDMPAFDPAGLPAETPPLAPKVSEESVPKAPEETAAKSSEASAPKEVEAAKSAEDTPKESSG